MKDEFTKVLDDMESTHAAAARQKWPVSMRESGGAHQYLQRILLRALDSASVAPTAKEMERFVGIAERAHALMQSLPA